MADKVLIDIAENITKAKVSLNQAKGLIEMLREVGEPTEKQTEIVADLERKVGRWEAMLSKRGVTIA